MCGRRRRPPGLTQPARCTSCASRHRVSTIITFKDRPVPVPPSEVIAELTERRQRKEPPVLRGNLGLLEAPRVLVRNVDGVKSGLERWKDRKSTRLNSSHANISYAVFCLKKK